MAVINIHVNNDDLERVEKIENLSQAFVRFLDFEESIRNHRPLLQYEPLTTPTLRDQFAMAALNATISTARGTINLDDMAKASKHAYQFADAMLEARR